MFMHLYVSDGEGKMEKAVLSFIKKHQLLTKGAKVLVGVSGGPDSIALLHFLKEIRKNWNLELIALSIDHSLRGEDSVADLEYVKAKCVEWEIDFHGVTLDVPAYEKVHRLSTEVAARKLRYQFFAEKMTELNADYLALGHHGDDQIETLLMKLVRSASSTAFLGIPVRRKLANGEIIRPLLAVTKKDIEAYCVKYGLKPRIDATNFETVHTRNYYRKHVLPLLKEKNRNIHITAQHLSETLQEDESYLQKEARKVFEKATSVDYEKHSAILEINLFKKHDQSLQRRAFHLILNYLYDETLPNQLSYIHEAQFFALLRHAEGNVQIDFPNALKLNKAYDKLTFYFDNQHPQLAPFHKTLFIPGSVQLPDLSTVTADLVNCKPLENHFSFYIAKSEVALPLHIRTRKPGDRMSWKGLNGTKKIKDIFIDAKIPIEERKNWPILVDNEGKILWLIGLKKGMSQEVSDEQFIYIQYEKGNL